MKRFFCFVNGNRITTTANNNLMFLKKEASKQGKSRDFVTLNKMPSLRRAE
jgi:hypothetical protein